MVTNLVNDLISTAVGTSDGLNYNLGCSLIVPVLVWGWWWMWRGRAKLLSAISEPWPPLNGDWTWPYELVRMHPEYTGLLGCKTKIFWVVTRGGGAYRSLGGHIYVNGSNPYHLLTFPSFTSPFLCSHPAPRASVSASSLALPMEQLRECVFLTLVSSFILETFTSGDQLLKCCLSPIHLTYSSAPFYCMCGCLL